MRPEILDTVAVNYQVKRRGGKTVLRCEMGVDGRVSCVVYYLCHVSCGANNFLAITVELDGGFEKATGWGTTEHEPHPLLNS